MIEVERRSRWSADPLRLVIVNHCPVVWDRLRGMLGTQPDFEVVGEAASGDETPAVMPPPGPAVRAAARDETVLPRWPADALLGCVRSDRR